MRPSTLCPKMDDGLEIYGLEIYGLETLANLTESVEVASLAPEMGRAAAAVVTTCPLPPVSWLSRSHGLGKQPLEAQMQQVNCLLCQGPDRPHVLSHKI